MSVELRFGRAPVTSSPVPLRFGEDEFDALNRDITIVGTFAALVVAVSVVSETQINITGTFAPLVLEAVAKYESGTQRPLVGTHTARHQDGTAALALKTEGFQGTTRLPAPKATRWQTADRAQGQWKFTSKATTHTRKSWEVLEQSGIRLRRIYQFSHSNSQRAPVQWQSRMQQGRKTGGPAREFSWQNTLHLRQVLISDWQVARPLSTRLFTNWQLGIPMTGVFDLPWEIGRRPPPGVSVIGPPVIPPGPVCYEVPPGDAVVLRFTDTRHSLALRFLCETGGIIIGPPPEWAIPVRRVYIVINDIQFKRVSDNQPIKINSGSMSIDRNSWAWGFNASLPYTERDLIEPGVGGPTEVELTINGYSWRFLVEDYTYDEQFNNSGLSVRGRSVTAYLDEPYAPTRTYAQVGPKNAVQLVDDELARPGLLGVFAQDWGLIDPLGWNVPEDSWSYQNLTPMAAIKAVAESVGGYVNSHPLDRTLLIRSGYPISPWLWDTTPADISVPRSIIRKQTLEWVQKPQYNGVFVSGERTGIVALVRRDGTIGDFQGPMYVNKLISDDPAAREYGRTFLAQGGPQANVGVELPLSPDTQLFSPGKLIEFTGDGFKGLVRGVTVSFSVDSGASKVGQLATVERHYY